MIEIPLCRLYRRSSENSTSLICPHFLKNDNSRPELSFFISKPLLQSRQHHQYTQRQQNQKNQIH